MSVGLHVKFGCASTGSGSRSIQPNPDRLADAGLERAAELTDEVLREAGVDRDNVLVVGVAVPGPHKDATGEFGSSTIVPGWVGVRAQRAFHQRLQLTVIVGNDADFPALAEATWGQAAGNRMRTCPAGRPYRGAAGLAGELGHVPVDRTGATCPCGNRGCIDSVVGTQALRNAVAPVLGALSVEELLSRAADGDTVAARVITDAAALIGEALVSLVNLLNPRLIVLCGPLARLGTLVVDEMTAQLNRGAVPATAQELSIRTSDLSERAGVLGAIAAGLRDRGLGIDRAPPPPFPPASPAGTPDTPPDRPFAQQLHSTAPTPPAPFFAPHLLQPHHAAAEKPVIFRA
jgi:predicted NBD/HSP70 family sugar kinase